MSDVTDKIDALITSLPEWQAENLRTFRALVHEVEPDIQEDWKWSVPVFLVKGKLVCAMSNFKEHTKYNFFEGAALSDPNKLFNSGLDSKQHRSLNLAEGQIINREHLAALIAEAVAYVKK